MRFLLLLLLFALAVPAVAQAQLGCIDTGNGSCGIRNTRPTWPLGMTATLKKTDARPTAAEIKTWLNPRRACPSYVVAQIMEAQGYPHRKDCDAPRYDGLGCIDTGNGCGTHNIGRPLEQPLRSNKGESMSVIGKTQEKPLVMEPMNVNAPAPVPTKLSCDYRGAYTGSDGKLFSRYAMRAQEELKLDRCTAERRQQHDRAMEAYNAKMSVWVPCATDAKKIARANFQTDEQAEWQIVSKCGSRPDLPREPEACINFWSGFETASQYDPRWIYLRHLELWEICLHKQVSMATERCKQGESDALTRVDEQIATQCGSQPARPLIDGKTPSSIQP